MRIQNNWQISSVQLYGNAMIWNKQYFWAFTDAYSLKWMGYIVKMKLDAPLFGLNMLWTNTCESWNHVTQINGVEQ